MTKTLWLTLARNGEIDASIVTIEDVYEDETDDDYANGNDHNDLW